MCETFCPFSSQNHSYTNQMPKIKSSKLEIKEKRYNNFDIFCANFSLFWLGNKLFLAVQDSSIGDLVTHSLSESVSESGFDFSDFREHCRAVVDTCVRANF